MESKAMTCPRCPRVPDKRKYVPLDFVTVERCCDKLLGLLEVRCEEMQKAIETMQTYRR
jgi:hypothetical protein